MGLAAAARGLTASERKLLGGALVLGLAVRIGWNLVRRFSGATGEAANVTIALAQGRGFADPFAVGQGPTAHLMPVSPAIGALVYRLLGVHTLPAEFVLSSWAIGLSFGSFAVLCAAAAHIGVPRAARIAALAFLFAAPTYSNLEGGDFRLWEGGLAGMLAALLLLLVLRHDRGSPSFGNILLGAGLAALLFFVSPPLGLAGYAMLILFAARTLSGHRLVLAVAAAAGALALLVVPWAIRNAAVMGEPILLRDNAGLELAISYYPGALDAPDRAAAFDARMLAVHPLEARANYDRMRASGGEIAYARTMGHAALDWIASAPGEAARLTLRHLLEYVFPQRWEFQTRHGTILPTVRSCLATLVSAFGLAGLWMGLRSGRPGFHYIAPLVILPPLVYMFFQPITRYTWLIYGPSTYLAAYAVHRLWKVGSARDYSIIGQRRADACGQQE